MEEKFQEVRKSNYLISNGSHWLCRTFEGKLFAQTPDFMSMMASKGNLFSLKDVKRREKNSYKKHQISNKEVEKAPEVEQKTEIKILFLGHYNSIHIGKDIQERENQSKIIIQDLLKKMAGALGLDDGQYSIFLFPLVEGSSIEGIDGVDIETKNCILEKLFLEKPQMIVSLGSVSTNILLRRKERLSKVHGDIFSEMLENQNGESISFSWMPVFHPEFFSINPTMKRTTWMDLKKLFEWFQSNKEQQ